MKNLVQNLKIFFGFAIQKRAAYCAFVGATLISALFFYTIPYFYKLFTDNLIQGDIKALYMTLLFLMVFRLSAMLFKNLAFFLGDRGSIDGASLARRTIFKHVQDLDFAFHSNKSTGYLISAFKRGDGAFWTMYFNLHHRFLDVFVGFLVMLYFLNQLAFTFTLLILMSFFLTFLLTKFLITLNVRARKLHNEDEDNLSAVITDNMINFETVKLFSKEAWELGRLKQQFIPWRASAIKYVNTYRYIDLSIGGLINLSIFLVLFFALRLFSRDELVLSDFILVLGFISSFYPRLFDLIWGLREVGKDFADIDRYFGLLSYGIEIKDPENPVHLNSVRGEIEFNNVTFTYAESKKEALENVNLRVRQGQSIALVGRSGSGKTTLMKLLMRFYDVDKGEILIDGVGVQQFTKSHLRSFMGVVPQEPVLFNNTIGYNIAYGKEKATRKEIVAAAKIANLHEFIETLPRRYETHVGERGIKLSGGQKQRLAIARMVLSDPDIIIFDEATSQLDSENELLIQGALWKVARNKTTIIIAHRLSTAMRADKIIVMEKGRIVETGSHIELLSKEKSLYKHFWNLQTNTV